MSTLTKYRQGSFRELISLALPLMLSSFSVMSMLFVDRLMLAHYSSSALNAAVNAATFGWAFIFGWMILTTIAEVFVAQFNGANKLERLGEPVWQMIWLSFMSIAVFVPLGIWGPELFYGLSPDREMHRDYFQWMMLFGPSFALFGALSGFFVGQGKTMLITCLALGANLVNAFMDMTLIFGIEGVIPSMGVKGAAIATSGCAVFQAIILFAIFLSRRNREKFGTNRYAFSPDLFWQCIKVGSPGAIFVVIELLGWSTFYSMMSGVGEKYITVAGICQSITIFLYFFGEGVNKAVATLTGNLIGAKQIELVPVVIRSGIKLHLTFFLLMAAFLWITADLVIEQFLPTVTPEVAETMYDALMVSLVWVLFHLLFEGIRMLYSAVLTAAGDTLFLLFAGSTSVWVFMVLPAYLIVVKGNASVEMATFLWVAYSILACIVYYRRFAKGTWKEIQLVT